ncbi:MAG: GNAT family N-acetyltransferase [Acidimicrobiia bacterium]|nr:GNAT family N-acetyltransferase [Acidimicrobiia bacterium]
MNIDLVPRLQGNGVRLRDLCDADIERRAALGRVPEIARGFGGNPERDRPMTEKEAGDELRRRFGPGPHWVIADQSDLFVGTVRLAPIDTANQSARFGIGIFDPDRLGLGLGSEATRLALRFGFAGLGLHRISLTVLADNTRAIAAYKKCGFVTEGRFRETLFRDGTWHDDLAMAILSSEWADHET